jgi:hypothetical protein
MRRNSIEFLAGIKVGWPSRRFAINLTNFETFR